MSIQNRQPRGIPVGGQYAVSTKGAACGVTLAEEAPHLEDWGAVNVAEGARTPWGAAQTVAHPAPGIVSVSTAGHGGIKLSRERNAAIPAPLRNSSGWYEEDQEAQIVGMYFPEAFPHIVDGRGADATRAYFENAVMSDYPDEYTAVTGIEVPVESSWVLQQRGHRQKTEQFRAQHADEFVTLGNGDNHAEWIPQGYAACKARMDSTGEERTFLMPRSEVIHDSSYGRHALVDPDRHLDVTEVVATEPEERWVYARQEVEPLHGDALGVDYSVLTSAQANRARAELERVWRFADGKGRFVTESMGEHLSRVGVVGKHPYVDGDKVTYSVAMPDSGVVKVSKATYDALAGVPDTSRPVDRAYVAKERARVAHEKARLKAVDTFSRADLAKANQAKEKYEAAAGEWKALSDEQDAKAGAWQRERARLRQEAFSRVAAEQGFAFDGAEQ